MPHLFDALGTRYLTYSRAAQCPVNPDTHLAVRSTRTYRVLRMVMHTRPVLPRQDSTRYNVAQSQQCRHVTGYLRHAPVAIRMVNALDSQESDVGRKDDGGLIRFPMPELSMGINCGEN